MKSLHAPNLKTRVLTKVMYMAIHSNDEQAFDLSEESRGGGELNRKEIVAACSKSRCG